ncbi:MAG: magnesium-translocating P-type ATPase [Rhizobiaceae bacterium]
MKRPLRRDDGAAPEDAYWSLDPATLIAALDASTSGLASTEARRRLEKDGPNSLGREAGTSALVVFARQFRSPLVLILIFAAAVSAWVGEGHEALIIAVIVLASCILSFTQEYGASKAMEALKARISQKARVVRDGREVEIAAEEVVRGDIVKLSAGNLVPADGVILESRDFNVSEAALTGETFPVVKAPGRSKADATLAERRNTVFAGTSVRSGTAAVLVARTGERTEFAVIASVIRRQVPETEFARGIRRFGYLMAEIMLVVVLAVFFANVFMHRPPIDSLLFSLALAVGLTPELLPAIISVTLARGAREMARSGVIVRRLDAIENLGSMDLLCTDKTGTLTEGAIHLDGCLDAEGKPSPNVCLWALLNATLQTGMQNPLDEAIAATATKESDLSAYAKVDEIPYDFVRKRLSVVVRRKNEAEGLMICKGAVQNVLDACSSFVKASKNAPLDDEARRDIERKYKAWSGDGYRVLALAIRKIGVGQRHTREEEADLSLAGFLLFLDPPKPGVTETLKALGEHGIAVKVITGDNRYVAAHLAETVGLRHRNILTGKQLSRLTRDALFGRVLKTDLFVEIDPNQKERIIDALRRRGHVVGYLGDGINDAPALHQADIGISVDSAVDVAREAADMILLRRDLGVLLHGIEDGRKTFANTMKYISITTSANFGNMVSMAFASLFLPFLPLLAKQILLNNFLADIPSLAIATDNVDADQTVNPRRWDIGFVRRFMISFGLISSLFDFVTFAFLLLAANADADTFRTGWFVESLLTQLSILLVIRTRKAFWQSRPSFPLAGLVCLIALLAVAMPYLPFSGWFGFVALRFSLLATLAGISLGYIVVSELTKRRIFAREHRRPRANWDV